MQQNRQYEPNQLFQIKSDHIIYKKENSVYNKQYNHKNKGGILECKESVPCITFPSLSKIPWIRHGFSTRLGGVSQGVFQTLNLSFYRGDDEKAVEENYNRILRELGMEHATVIFSDQVHDTIVHKVTEEDFPTTNKYERKLTGIDGLITNLPNVALVTSYADCVPLYFVDPVNRCIGLSHSGWKGTVNKIGCKTIEAMTKEYGTNSEDVIAVIGPSICFDCYEVSEDVAQAFQVNFSREQVAQFLFDKGNGKYQLDLWQVNKCILKEANIKEENIIISELCTCCNSSLFFSHRASNGKRGNLAAFLCMTEE